MSNVCHTLESQLNVMVVRGLPIKSAESNSNLCSVYALEVAPILIVYDYVPAT